MDEFYLERPFLLADLHQAGVAEIRCKRFVSGVAVCGFGMPCAGRTPGFPRRKPHFPLRADTFRNETENGLQ
jgi:hypothetical protein